SLARPDLVSSGRKQLVGLLTDDPNKILEEGAQLVDDPSRPVPMHMLGHVTSSYWSPNCGRSIALALVAAGRSLIDRSLYATIPQGFAKVRVCNPAFFDREGARVHA